MGTALPGSEIEHLSSGQVEVYYDPSLKSAALEIVVLYGEITKELETTFGWSGAARPSVVLFNNNRQFQMRAESPLTVAYAVPGRNLVAIDLTQVRKDPFTLRSTLKHEICHLLLHRHIDGERLPRWLDEGLCQWVSDGIADIIINPKGSQLNKAIIRGRFIPFRILEGGFPRDQAYLMLSYEQSKSFVDYMIDRFGFSDLLVILHRMERGEDVHGAFLEVFHVSLDELEVDWQKTIERKTPWLAHASYYMYEILFGFTALLAMLAFIKMILRKRAYRKTEQDDMD
jgi:hypothetical protein